MTNIVVDPVALNAATQGITDMKDSYIALFYQMLPIGLAINLSVAGIIWLISKFKGVGGIFGKEKSQ